MPTTVQLDNYHEKIVSCLNGRGFDGGSIEEADDVSDRAAVRRCSNEAEASVFNR